MRPADEEPKVRPIPITFDEEAPGSTPAQQFTVERSRRRRVALLVALLFGLLLVGSAIGAWMTRDSEGVETTPEVENSGPHLGPEAQLLIASEVIDGNWVVIWDRLEPPPTTTGLIGLIPAPGSPEAAGRSIDAGGTVLAGEVCRSGACVVALTAADDPLVRLATIDGTGFVWHAGDPLRIAWTEDDRGRVTLRTGTVDRATGSIVGATRLGSVAEGERLVRWDDDGFIVAGAHTRALRPDGENVWAFDGSLLDSSSAVVTVATPEDGWVIVDRISGRVIMASVHGAEAIVVADVQNAESSVSTDGYRYTITFPLGASGTRILSLGSAPGTGYRIYRDGAGTTLTVSVVRPVSASTTAAIS